MSVATEIERLQAAKSSIKTAIENKGVTVGDGTLDTYAEKIDNIETGGGDVSEYFNTYVEQSNTNWIINNFIKKAPDIVISDNVSNLSSFASYGSGINAPKIICNSNVITVDRMFYNSYYQNIDLSGLDLTNVTSLAYMFANCSNLKKIDFSKNTLRPTTIERLCYSSKIQEIDLTGIDTSQLKTVGYAFAYCSNITTFKGLKDVGQAFLTTTSANNWAYELNFSNSNKLSYESLMTIINNLYDIATKGCNTQKLVLGSTNMAKLTAEEISICTSKGWSVS